MEHNREHFRQQDREPYAFARYDAIILVPVELYTKLQPHDDHPIIAIDLRQSLESYPSARLKRLEDRQDKQHAPDDWYLPEIAELLGHDRIELTTVTNPLIFRIEQPVAAFNSNQDFASLLEVVKTKGDAVAGNQLQDCLEALAIVEAKSLFQLPHLDVKKPGKFEPPNISTEEPSGLSFLDSGAPHLVLWKRPRNSYNPLD